jgi:hypothetical protein
MSGDRAELGQARRLLAATMNVVRVECDALTAAQLAWRPGDDDWCIKEVIGHLVEADRRGFAGRIRHILTAERPALATWDQPAVSAARGDHRRPARRLLDEFFSTRTEGLNLLRQVTPGQLDRTGLHPDVGELRVRDLLHEWVFHDRAHLQQILENVKLLLWPQMGNARRFSRPDLAAE